jgi:F-box/leucine-rich repeat protein 10/11
VEDQAGLLNALEKERWIRCDACKTWYHWRCVGHGDDIESIDKWCAALVVPPSLTTTLNRSRFCQKCIEEKPSRVITRKAPARKSSRIKTQRDYASLDSGISFDPARWLKILEEKRTDGDPFKRMHGGDLSVSWLDEDEMAMREPIVIENPEGLELKMPSSTLTVNEVAELVGKDTLVEVIGACARRNPSSVSDSPV